MFSHTCDKCFFPTQQIDVFPTQVINVYAPDLATRRPVMVFIHGGGFFAGLELFSICVFRKTVKRVFKKDENPLSPRVWYKWSLWT